MKSKLLCVFLLASLIASSQINWSPCTNGKPFDFAPIDMAMAPNGDVYTLCSKMVSGGYEARLLKSTNGGNLWTEIIMTGIPQIQSMALIFAGNKLLTTGLIPASNSHEMYASLDSGQTWSLCNTGLAGSYSFRDFTKDNAGNVYLAGTKPLGAGITTYLAKSTDNGATWIEVQTNGVPANAIGYKALGYGGGKLFMARYDYNLNIELLMASTDSGLNWTNSNNGIISGFTTYDFATSLNGEIFAVGTVQGIDLMYSSTDNGLTWNQVSTQGTNGMDTPMAMLQSNGPMFICGVSSSFFTTYIFRDQADVGLNENEAQAFQLFPVPANDHLKIEAGDHAISDIQQVEIISVRGETVKIYLDHFADLDITSLEPGIYVLQLKTSTSVLNKRFVKQD